MLLLMVIDNYHSLVIDISSLCYVFSFSYQGHVTVYLGFPTMPGMDDVMFLFYLV